MIFEIYDCDFGIKYNGVNYDFDHVMSLTVEDPESTKLVRGANGNNKLGLVYKEGIKDPKRVTVTIAGMSAALKGVLDQAFENRDRLDVYTISRTDGSSKIFKNSVLSQQPQQLTLDDSPDALNVALAFESFDMTETHKS